MVQECLSRPIEMSREVASNDITWDPDPPGGAAFAKVDFGVYASLPPLLDNLAAAIGGDITTLEIDVNHKAKFTWAASTSLEFLSSNMQAALGFDNAVYASAATHIAENISPFLWLPTFQGNDIQGWHQINNIITGERAVDGSRAGFELGPTLYQKTLMYGFEPILNVYEEAALDSVDTSKAFVNFIRESKTIQTSVSDSSNISAKGFYYFPDFEDLKTLSTLDSGGINFNYTSSPDTYVFCHYDSERIVMPSNSFNRGRVRYHVEIPIHTATAPTWLVDGAP